MIIPTRPTYHHGDLRNSLIRAALGLVAERGVEGFSLREAARTVGVSASACYRHFADREELLAAVAHEGLDTLADEDARRRGGPRGRHAPFDAVRRFWDYSERVPALRARASRALPGHARRAEVGAQPRDHAAAQPGRAGAGGHGRPRRRPASSTRTAAGRALLACWTSVHGLASLAVNGHLPRRRRARRWRPRSTPCCARPCSARAPTRRCSRPSSRYPAAPARGSPSSCASRTPPRRLPRVPLLDLTPDELLSTTRAVRKRLDFERPVEREVLDECLALAQQAPERVQLRAVALRRRDRAGHEGEARRVLRDRLGRLPQGDRRARRRCGRARRC